MSAFYFETAGEKFEPQWLEFHKPVFLANYGYVNSVSMGGDASSRPDRPSCAGSAKLPEGWLVWMQGGGAALIPDNNIKYVAATHIVAHAQLPQAPAGNRFDHLPQELQAAIAAQADGGHIGDAAPTPVPQPPSVEEAPKKRRGRPPKAKPAEVAEATA